MERLKKYGPALLRIGISGVFLWFAINQLFATNNFINLIPEWIVSLSGISPAVFVIENGVLELILGIFLLLGIHVRFSAFVLGIHLMGIAFSLGYGPTMIRDLGLTIATFSVFLNEPDELCLDRKKVGYEK